MKIQQKLTLGFAGISCLVGLVGGVAIYQQFKSAKDLAVQEAENAVEILSHAITHENKQNPHGMYGEAATLQAYVEDVHQLQHRDLEVVDRNKQIIADVVTKDIGTFFEDDPNQNADQTLKDGVLRTFIEKNEEHPDGIRQIMAPLRLESGEISGLVILEYTPLYNQAIAQATPSLVMIASTSVACIALALILGWRISRSISQPLQVVTEVAHQVTQQADFSLQVPITSKDEISTLATSFNHLVQRVQTLLQEKEQRSTELQNTLEELHHAQSHMIQSEKMSALGQMVAGVAHEINNPVNFIYGNLSHVDEYTKDLLALVQTYQQHFSNPPDPVLKHLEEVELDFLTEDLTKILQSMKVGTDRIREIVLSLRNFSRLDESDFKAVNLHEGIDNTLMILNHRLKARADRPAIEVVKDYGQLPLVECYPGQLNQVFMNLLSNAIDALEEANQGLDFQDIAANPNQIHIHTQLSANQQVMIAIQDNGVGISETAKARLFNPFFTTKPIGKGTGLGLSISYQIVTEKHGGKLWCDSISGKGTKFLIELPLHPKLSVVGDRLKKAES